ncbi:hypothetical protein PYCC9005_001837 [Savitreella phatthalungensis]
MQIQIQVPILLFSPNRSLIPNHSSFNRSTNTIVGSRAAKVLIVNCDPTDSSLNLRTAIPAGHTPFSTIVDVDNKCFYALDAHPQTSQGIVRTLAPTPAGTVEQQLSSCTEAPNPTAFYACGAYIYVLHASGDYAIFRRPRPPRSTRRRRSSTLIPIREDVVGESLAELYRLSKDTPVSDPNTSLEERAEASIQTIKQELTHVDNAPAIKPASVDAIELVSVITCEEGKEIRRIVPWHDEAQVLLARRDGVVICGVDILTGNLNERAVLPLAQLTDCDCRGSSLICVLTEDELIVVSASERNDLSIVKRHPIKGDLIRVSSTGHAYVRQTSSWVNIDLDTGDQKALGFVSDELIAHRDGRTLLCTTTDALRMYTIEGKLQASLSLDQPTIITRMT